MRVVDMVELGRGKEKEKSYTKGFYVGTKERLQPPTSDCDALTRSSYLHGFGVHCGVAWLQLPRLHLSGAQV